MGRVLVLAMIWLTACSGDDKPRRELVDDGVVCLRLLPSGAVEVDVVFHDCLSSCDIARPATCVVTKEETNGAVDLRVASRGVVESTGASVCSPSCGELRAFCTSDDTFAPGTLTVRHGEDTSELVLGTRVQCLFSQ